MRTILPLLLALPLIFAGLRPAAAQFGRQRRGISVTGTATTLAKPDTARFDFAVYTVSTNLEAAREANAKWMEKILKSVAALNLPDARQISARVPARKVTTRFPTAKGAVHEASPRLSRGLRLRTHTVRVSLIRSNDTAYGYLVPAPDAPPPGRPDRPARYPGTDRPPRSVRLRFQVINSMTVQIVEPDDQKLGDLVSLLIDTVLRNGANHLGRLYFSVQDREELRHKLLVAALRDARERAETAAETTGIRLGRVRMLNASYYSFLDWYPIDAYPGGGSGFGGYPGTRTRVISGQYTYQGRVTVTYDIR